jgi:hypothetical protein
VWQVGRVYQGLIDGIGEGEAIPELAESLKRFCAQILVLYDWLKQRRKLDVDGCAHTETEREREEERENE